MAKLHDIVETSKMSAEYDGSLIDNERVAATDLDNGRLAIRDGNSYKYPTAVTDEDLYLITTPEKTYETVNMTEFYNKQGKKIRTVRVMFGDQFGTTAVSGELAIGDTATLKATTGELIVKSGATDPAIEFTVVEKKYLSGFPAVVVERTK